ncbi:diacylglycerol/polyprenol kinase family protein [Cyanobacterium sp. IPPAS B-1200]|uniref:diacylglycerol/polyprenol kinase family protein n=1 Tax=Cyanobacterium sp. IPPAS B-1200 TaxID=1562720 RepID=UPI0008524C96|nr:diacylglycerol/polyprenol kinase family protein [Cyanobacterium sp. IPPAS B-1200]OEJ79011.1 phosphatidate cytidylyltransferase [Cyanobacterium sp. IPPAS B-1200]
MTLPFHQNLSILLVGLYLGILILVSEILRRYYQANSEITRKIVHIGAGQVILLAWWLNIPSHLILLASIGASIVAILSYFLPILPSVNGVGRKSLGTLFYALSIGILTFLFWDKSLPQFTAIGILIMTWGDASAALIGQKWGKNKYQFLRSTKSWEGSFTMFVVSAIVILIILFFVYPWQYYFVIVALLTALIATILESFSIVGIDNLTVPVLSAIFCYYSLHFFI